MKILILDYEGSQYSRPFREHGEVVEILSSSFSSLVGEDNTIVDSYDLVVFTGGEDVCPILYGEVAHPTTSFNIERDADEVSIFDACAERGIAMAGICRGSQFLNVRSGGGLIQNASGHGIGGTHAIELLLEMDGFDSEGVDVQVTSTHHQISMCTHDARVLAIGKEDSVFEGVPEGRDDILLVETEAFYYPHTKCLGVQFHPEYMPEDSSGYQYYQALLKQFCFKVNSVWGIPKYHEVPQALKLDLRPLPVPAPRFLGIGDRP